MSDISALYKETDSKGRTNDQKDNEESSQGAEKAGESQDKKHASIRDGIIFIVPYMYDHSADKTRDKADTVYGPLGDPTSRRSSLVDVREKRETKKMKHGVPLTPFQERLYEVVLNAFKPPEKPAARVKEYDTSVTEGSKIQYEQAEISYERKEYPKATWKDDVKFWAGCIFEWITEHINSIFLLIMTGNILWMQIITSHMSRDNARKESAEVFKWILIITTVIYIAVMMTGKVKAGWVKLRIWAEK